MPTTAKQRIPSDGTRDMQEAGDLKKVRNINEGRPRYVGTKDICICDGKAMLQ